MSVEVTIQKNLGTFKLDIDFRSDSRRIGILGASGCGKSLTLKSIAGIERPDVGNVIIDNKTIYDSKKRINLRPQERNIGYLFQNYALFPTMTVEQNIGTGLKCGRAERREKVEAIMQRFQIAELAKRLPGQLSGGQQQRVALARILVYEPDMILLDEPFSALDIYLKDKMIRECMELLEDYPGTVILVSHSRDEIYRFSEEAMVIDKGKILVQKPVRELFADPEKVEAARLTGCKNIADVKLLSDGYLRVPDWGMVLGHPGTERKIDAVGIRAHEFVIKKEQKKEYYDFAVLEPQVTEDLFEYNVSFLPSPEAVERTDWKISKYQWDIERDGIPEKLYLEKSKILGCSR